MNNAYSNKSNWQKLLFISCSVKILTPMLHLVTLTFCYKIGIFWWLVAI